MKPVKDLTLGGRYRLISRIAVGGMGEVWVAHDNSLARNVALKVLREEFAGNEDFLARLRTEARNSAGLSHTNIAQLYDYGEQNGSGYLVMELIIGEPMSDLLERSPVLPLRQLLPILSQTARGLHAAHVGGVVHRDIKPGNILLENNMIVKITDFGVSLAANQVPMTAAGMVMGTAQYLSPEQAIGRAATGASDIYALGIVAYESLVGHRPFTGPTAVDIAVAHVNEAVPALPGSVHPELGDLVMQMLEKDPTKRPRSGASLARILDEFAENLDDSPYGNHRIGRRGIGTTSVPPVSPASGLEQPDPRRATNTPAAVSTPSPVALPVRTPPPLRTAEPTRQSGVSGTSTRTMPPTIRPVPTPPVRSTPTVRPQGARRSPARTPRPAHATRSQPPTTGRRMGNLSWPLMGLIMLLVLLALGALINQITGRGDGSAAQSTANSQIQYVDSSPIRSLDAISNGMIDSVTDLGEYPGRSSNNVKDW